MCSTENCFGGAVSTLKTATEVACRVATLELLWIYKNTSFKQFDQASLTLPNLDFPGTLSL